MRPVVLALALFGCSDLPDLAANTCGNGVIDPGEDCDPHGAPDKCSGAATPSPCRWLCDPQLCPPGWSCDTGAHICRHGTGHFSAGPELRRVSDGLLAGDMDGDGRLDLVTWNGDRVEILYGDGTGAFGSSSLVATPGRIGAPAVGPLHGHSAAYVAVMSGAGLLLFSGGRARNPSPIVPPTGPAAGYRRVVPINLGPSAPNRAHELLVLEDDKMFIAPAGGGAATNAFAIDDPSKLAPSGIVVADLDGDGVDEVLLAYGAPSRSLLGFRIDESAGTPALQSVDSLAIDLPATIDRGVTVADVDGDGLIDLVASTGAPDAPSVLTFKNLGNGRFDVATEWLEDFPCGSEHWPLAMGNLRYDPAVRFPPVNLVVGDQGVCLVGKDGRLTVVASNPHPDSPWTEAAIGDFNGDGHADVATVAADQGAVTFWLGDGAGGFNPFEGLAGGVASRLRVGDFDGDFHRDLAVVSPPGLVSIFYGVDQGAPAEAVPVADLGSVLDIAPGRFAPSGAVADATDDLVVLRAEGADSSIGVLFGSAERRMYSPFALPPNVHGDDVKGVAIGETGLGFAFVAFVAPPDIYTTSEFSDGGFVTGQQPVCPGATVPSGSGTVLLSASLGVIAQGDSLIAVSGCDEPSAPEKLTVCQGPSGEFAAPTFGCVKQLMLTAPGNPDLIVLGRDQIEVLPDLFSAFDGTSPIIIDAPGTLAIAALNLNDDVDEEIAFVSDTTLSFLHRNQTARQTFSPFASSILVGSGGATRAALVAADVNGDGLDDLIVSVPPTIKVYLQVDHQP